MSKRIEFIKYYVKKNSSLFQISYKRLYVLVLFLCNNYIVYNLIMFEGFCKDIHKLYLKVFDVVKYVIRIVFFIF